MPTYSRATPRRFQGTGPSYSKHATVHNSAGNRSIVMSSHTSPSLAASRSASRAPPPTHIIVLLFFLFLVVLPAGHLSLERLLAAQTIPQPRHPPPASACELSCVTYRVCSTVCDAVFISNRPFTRRKIAYAPEACCRGSWSMMWCGQGDERPSAQDMKESGSEVLFEIQRLPVSSVQLPSW